MDLKVQVEKKQNWDWFCNCHTCSGRNFRKRFFFLLKNFFKGFCESSTMGNRLSKEQKQVSKWPRYNADLIPHRRTDLWVWVLCVGPHSPQAFPSGRWAHATQNCLLYNPTFGMAYPSLTNPSGFLTLVYSPTIQHHQFNPLAHLAHVCPWAFGSGCILHLVWPHIFICQCKSYHV